MSTASVFGQLPLDQLEEVAGELLRRAGAALRAIGEAQADDPDAEGVSPRRRVAELIAATELVTATLGAIAGSLEAPRDRLDRAPAVIAALIYGAPTLAGLLARLEQDRRALASLARHLEPRLDERHSTAWGDLTPRDLVIRHAIEEPARHAQALEQQLAILAATPPDDPST